MFEKHLVIQLQKKFWKDIVKIMISPFHRCKKDL